MEGVRSGKRPRGPGAVFLALRYVHRRLPLARRRRQRLAEAFFRAFPRLRTDPASAPNVLAAAGRHRFEARNGRPPHRVLVIDRSIPTPDRMASGVRAMQMLRALRQLGHPVTFVCDWRRDQHRGILERVDTEIVPYERALADLDIACVYGLEEAVAHLEEAGAEYGAAFLAWPEIMNLYLPLVRTFAPRARVVYDTVDLHWVRLGREARLHDDRHLIAKAEGYLRLEHCNVACADAVLAVSEPERQAILERFPERRVEVVPVAYETVPEIGPLAGRRGWMFIGQFLNPGNEDAVRWFIREVLPLLRVDFPDHSLHVLGASLHDVMGRLSRHHGVDAVGYVADPVPYFQRSRVFVAPLRFGAGVKGKVAHSLSQGLPVVTTPVGAEGMGLTDGAEILLAESAEEFRGAIARLATDDGLWRRLSDAGRRWSEANGSLAEMGAVLAALAEPVAPIHLSGEAATTIIEIVNQRRVSGIPLDGLAAALERRARSWLDENAESPQPRSVGAC